MIKIINILLLLVVPSFAFYSLLAPSVPQPLEQLNAVVTQRSNSVKNKLNNMKNGVIENIKTEIKNKKDNTQRLKKLSKLDYVTNSEFLFLVKKLNHLTNNSIDAQNATTKAKSIELNISKKQKGND